MWVACFALLLCGTGLSTSWLFFAPYLLDSSSMQSLRTVPPSLLGSSPHVLVFFLLPPLWEVPSHCCGFPISPKQPGQTGIFFSLLLPEPSWASSWAALLGVRNLAENPGHQPLQPSSTSSACSLLPSWPVLEHAVPSSPVRSLQLGSFACPRLQETRIL